MLVSTTDTRGVITYCNDAFIEASGLSREALIGQPHNVVRHPDMPAEVYRDMWATLKKREPWVGVLKNRFSKGRHCWVQTGVTPIIEGQYVVAYRAVHTAASRDQVRAAEALYATLLAEQRAGRQAHHLQARAIVRKDMVGRLARFVHPTMKTQTYLLRCRRCSVPGPSVFSGSTSADSTLRVRLLGATHRRWPPWLASPDRGLKKTCSPYQMSRLVQSLINGVGSTRNHGTSSVWGRRSCPRPPPGR
ncbi:PAS domain-containing protein [Paraburkholderia sp. EG287B]|uniref:PAS domain-containing protein n=1 Tax=Paraburkholderia sp. EG287B TaxID=3237010 RepID=UPI0034D19B95